MCYSLVSGVMKAGLQGTDGSTFSGDPQQAIAFIQKGDPNWTPPAQYQKSANSGSVTPPPVAPGAAAPQSPPRSTVPSGPSSSSSSTGFDSLVLPRTDVTPVDRSVPTG